METVSGWPTKVYLASPRGFCAGVVMAIETLKEVQRLNPDQTVYSYHEIIHNNHVVNDFEKSGVRFVNSVEEVPEGTPLVLSAHGVSPKIMDQAEQRRHRVIDATCPLVNKTHTEARRFLDEGRTVLYIGHAGHDETEGTLGFAPEIKLIEKEEDIERIEVPDPEKVALITQTTLSMDDAAKIRSSILKRFPNLVEPSRLDICFATQNRQDGVKGMINMGAQAIVVCGSPTSSNSARLTEVALAYGAPSFLVDEASLLDPRNFTGFRIVGLTSGASAPEDKFLEVVDFFQSRGSLVETLKVTDDENNRTFALPKGLG